MFKALAILFLGLISHSSWGWSVREVWPKASREQKLVLLQHYREFFKSYPSELADWKDKRSVIIELFQKAYAAEMNCVFAGWPSLKVGELCEPPTTHNPAYNKGSCGENQLQCQPLLFGSGVCVDVATKKQRNRAFGYCEKAFHDVGKTYDQILDEVDSGNKRAELMTLLSFADQTCQTGFQSTQLLCRRLEAAVDGMKEAIENKETPTDQSSDASSTDGTRTTGGETSGASSDLVGVAGSATTLNDTVGGAGLPPTGCGSNGQTSNDSTGNSSGNTSATTTPVVINGVYGPEQAIADINSGELTFVGRELFEKYEERSCVFKSQSAFVIYHNCMADRREHPNTDIEVVAFTGEVMRFYVENSEARPEISTLSRAAYDYTWSINFKKGPPLAGSSDMNAIKSFKSSLDADFSGSCWVGETGGAKAQAEPKCHGSLAPQQANWAQVSQGFWSQPPESWGEAKRLLRTKVQTARF